MKKIKVSDTRLVIAVDPSDAGPDNLDLPERCRVVKLANSVTYDRYISLFLCEQNCLYEDIRMETALDRLEKIVIPSRVGLVPHHMPYVVY